MVTGGSEAALTPLVVAGFANMHALTKRYNDSPTAASRPFDRDRSGFVQSEGAAVVVLENLQHALNRNARIYALMVGQGQSNDGRHVTEPDPEGAGSALAMNKALRNAGISPQEVDYINAHGTSTPLNDRVETAAIKRVFGTHAYNLLVSSTKSMTGHLLGATAGVEAVICALALNEGIVPPTINLDNQDFKGGCDLNYVPHRAVNARIKVAMSNAFGFGGHDSVIVFRNYQA